MPKRIHFEVIPTYNTFFKLDLHLGAEVLGITSSGTGRSLVWICANENRPTETRTFVYTTDRELPDEARPLAFHTEVDDDAEYAFTLFEIPKKPCEEQEICPKVRHLITSRCEKGSDGPALLAAVRKSYDGLCAESPGTTVIVGSFGVVVDGTISVQVAADRNNANVVESELAEVLAAVQSLVEDFAAKRRKS